MIKLKKPLNHRGLLCKPGESVTLPPDIEAKMVENGSAERCIPEIQEVEPSPTFEELLQTKTKAELLEYVEQAEIEDITGQSKKEEIITALIEAVNDGFELQL